MKRTKVDIPLKKIKYIHHISDVHIRNLKAFYFFYENMKNQKKTFLLKKGCKLKGFFFSKKKIKLFIQYKKKEANKTPKQKQKTIAGKHPRQ